MSPYRLRGAVATAALVAVPLLAALPAGTAAAGQAPTASCTPPLDPACLTSPAPSPTPSPTPVDSPTPSPTPHPTPRPTHRVTHRPTTRATTPVAPGSTESPVTSSVGLAQLSVGPASPTPLPSAAEQGHTSHAGSSLTQLIELVLGGALLLGIAGATGLYLTRNPHEH